MLFDSGRRTGAPAPESRAAEAIAGTQSAPDLGKHAVEEALETYARNVAENLSAMEKKIAEKSAECERLRASATEAQYNMEIAQKKSSELGERLTAREFLDAWTDQLAELFNLAYTAPPELGEKLKKRVESMQSALKNVGVTTLYHKPMSEYDEARDGKFVTLLQGDRSTPPRGKKYICRSVGFTFPGEPCIKERLEEVAPQPQSQSQSQPQPAAEERREGKEGAAAQKEPQKEQKEQRDAPHEARVYPLIAGVDFRITKNNQSVQILNDALDNYLPRRRIVLGTVTSEKPIPFRNRTFDLDRDFIYSDEVAFRIFDESEQDYVWYRFHAFRFITVGGILYIELSRLAEGRKKIKTWNFPLSEI